MAFIVQLQWSDYGEVHELLKTDLQKEINSTVKPTNLVTSYYGIVPYETKTDFIFNILVADNLSMDMSSQFTTISDRMGGLVGSTAGLLQATGAAFGTLSGLAANFDFLIWEKTEPLNLSLELEFRTQKDSFLDVYLPMKSLASMGVLTARRDGGYLTPGVNLSNYGRVASSSPASANRGNPENINVTIGEISKFLSINIPGRIKIDTALVTQATPEYSAETTDQDCPLWGRMDLRLTTLYPASDKILASSLEDMFNKRRNNIDKANNPNFNDIIKKRTPLGDIVKVFG